MIWYVLGFLLTAAVLLLGGFIYARIKIGATFI